VNLVIWTSISVICILVHLASTTISQFESIKASVRRRIIKERQNSSRTLFKVEPSYRILGLNIYFSCSRSERTFLTAKAVTNELTLVSMTKKERLLANLEFVWNMILAVPIIALALFRLKEINSFDMDPVPFIILALVIILFVGMFYAWIKLKKGREDINLSESSVWTVRVISTLETIAFYLLVAELMLTHLSLRAVE
jgi:hypothetical protein